MLEEQILPLETIEDVVGDDESLMLVMESIQEFNDYFCKFMVNRADFTLRLEVHGNVGEILHCRAYIDVRKQPKVSQKRIDKKSNRNKFGKNINKS